MCCVRYVVKAHKVDCACCIERVASCMLARTFPDGVGESCMVLAAVDRPVTESRPGDVMTNGVGFSGQPLPTATLLLPVVPAAAAPPAQ